ncbi:UNVERIFIED_CONTAM: hypothetical protein PYX00_001718 [Menopon gallinae]
MPHDLGFRSYHRNDCGWPSCYRNSTHFHCSTCGYGTSQVTNAVAHRRVCTGSSDVQISSDANLIQHEILQSSSPFTYYSAMTPTGSVGLSSHGNNQSSNSSKIINPPSTMFNFVIPAQSSQYGTLYGTQSVFPNSNLFSPSSFNSFGQLDSPWLSQTRIIPPGVHPPTSGSPDINRTHLEKGDVSTSGNGYGKIGSIESTAIGMCSPLTAEAFKVVSKELQNKIESQNWCCGTQGVVGFGIQNTQQSSCRFSDSAPQCSFSLLLLEQNDLKQAEECITADDFNFETAKSDEKINEKETSEQCFDACLEISKEGAGKDMDVTEGKDENLEVEGLLTQSNDENIDLESLTTSEDTDIIVEESETETIDPSLTSEELKLRCLVCNKSAPLLSVNNFISLSEEMPLTTTTQVSVLSKVSQVIDDESLNKLKDCSICPRCLNLINVVDRLEIKLKSVKDELIDMYKSKEKSVAVVDNPVENVEEATDNKLCNICNKTFSSSHYLEKHKQCHTKVFSYYCEYCGKGFAILRKLENHLLLHSNSSRFQCEMCGKRFAQKHTLTDHIRQHKGEYAYRCSVCNKGFVRKSVYKIHLQIHSGDSLICHCCGRQFKNSANLSVHVKQCSGDLKFSCNKCEKKFPIKSLLIRHVSLKHDSRYNFVCTICRKGFGKNSDLKTHLRSHSDSKPYNCTKCNNSYKSLSNLNQHMKVHSSIKALECNICNKQFTRNDSLKDHLNQHTGNKPYKCTTCWKTFANRINYNNHTKRHSGTLKQTPCPICGKLFAKGLKDHLISHSGQKPYSCKQCLAVFTVKSSLNKHVRTKHISPGSKA